MHALRKKERKPRLQLGTPEREHILPKRAQLWEVLRSTAQLQKNYKQQYNNIPTARSFHLLLSYFDDKLCDMANLKLEQT